MDWTLANTVNYSEHNNEVPFVTHITLPQFPTGANYIWVFSVIDKNVNTAGTTIYMIIKLITFVSLELHFHPLIYLTQILFGEQTITFLRASGWLQQIIFVFLYQFTENLHMLKKKLFPKVNKQVLVKKRKMKTFRLKETWRERPWGTRCLT